MRTCLVCLGTGRIPPGRDDCWTCNCTGKIEDPEHDALVKQVRSLADEVESRALQNEALVVSEEIRAMYKALVKRVEELEKRCDALAARPIGGSGSPC
ncbi:hypothetical protein LCGC14_1537870 [marine sediment metagenome]|uniref:Uncharacterized protein n=1 Tax=marine sediment metagenome TaxID=412755 RepID=A0A0F9IU40_9ZZZZ